MHSLAIVLFEIASQEEPYANVRSISESVIKGLRPSLPCDCPIQIKQAIEQSWSKDPTCRLSASKLGEMLASAAPHCNNQLPKDFLDTEQPAVVTEVYYPYRIRMANNAWTQVFGYLQEEAIGSTLELLCGRETEQSALDEISLAARRHCAMSVSLTQYSKDKRAFRSDLTLWWEAVYMHETLCVVTWNDGTGIERSSSASRLTTSGGLCGFEGVEVPNSAATVTRSVPYAIDDDYADDYALMLD